MMNFFTFDRDRRSSLLSSGPDGEVQRSDPRESRTRGWQGDYPSSDPLVAAEGVCCMGGFSKGVRGSG